MPTGYTADIYEGKEVSFEDFALNAARAFGAMAGFRDDPNATIPEKFESNAYAEGLLKAEKRVAEVGAWTNSEADLLAEANYYETLEEYYETVAEKNALKGRYNTMLSQVKAWTPPTSEHVKYKDFMVEQLEGSIHWDCNLQYDHPPTRQTGEEFKAATLADARRSVEFYAEWSKKEDEKNKEKTEWIKALRDSLVQS